jgi:carboxylesterase
MLPGLLLVAAIAGIAIWRDRYLREVRRVAARRPLSRDGVVIGGAGFQLDRPDAPALLLLHGAGDTPQTLRYLADALFERGYHVAAPLLPGHGRSVADFERVTADELSEAARSHYRIIKDAHPWVAVIGLSMGGALAAQIAAEDPSLPALGLLAPYLAMPRGVRRAAHLSRVWGAILPQVLSADGVSIQDPSEQARSLAYGVFTPAALRALYTTMRRGSQALPRIVAPTIMIQSREDNRIAVDDAEAAFARIGSANKRLEWVTGAGHVITVDYGRDRIFSLLADFMDAQLRMRTPIRTLEKN